MILSFSKTWPWNSQPTNFEEKIKRGEKIHTIREDKHRRWREGMEIHFATGVRTPDYNQFHGDVCTGVQEIKILYNPGLHVRIGNRILYHSQVKELANNDGFNGIDHFFKWFDEDFEGRLIHWTDKRY